MIELKLLFSKYPSDLVLINSKTSCKKYYNYKKYVDLNKACNNLRLGDNELLYKYLDVYSLKRNKYNDMLYHNLQNIEIGLLLNSKKLVGSYYIDNNSNVITYSGDKDVIYHELLHMASSCFDNHNKIIRSGFFYYDLIDNYYVGEGLTEGYTELLYSRDMCDASFIRNVNKKLGFYDYAPYSYASTLVEQLELIIGKDKLEKMYFKTDLEGLIDELSNYSSKKDIIKFMKNCDVSINLSENRNSIFYKNAINAQRYLYNICSNYMPEKLDKFKECELVDGSKCGFSKLVPIKVIKESEELKKYMKK